MVTFVCAKAGGKASNAAMYVAWLKILVNLTWIKNTMDNFWVLDGCTNVCIT